MRELEQRFAVAFSDGKNAGCPLIPTLLYSGLRNRCLSKHDFESGLYIQSRSRGFEFMPYKDRETYLRSSANFTHGEKPAHKVPGLTRKSR
jgi:hypothetical protein